jgi:hypothetical protein
MATEFGHKCEHIFIQKEGYDVDWTLKCVVFSISVHLELRNVWN